MAAKGKVLRTLLVIHRSVFGGSEICPKISLKLRGLKFVSQKMWGLKFNSQKNVGSEISIQNVGSEIFVRKFVGS